MINFRGSRQLVGQFVEVTVTAAMTHSLRGDVCATA
jgi:hypothetical protein